MARSRMVVLNYYHDGCPFDFTLELHKIEASIESHKARILSDKHNIADSIEALPDLISDLQIIWNRVIAPKYMRNAMGSYPYPPNIWIKQEFDSILIYRKPGQPDLPPMKDRVGNEIPKKEWFEMVQPIWAIPPEGNRNNSNHPATFPNKIPRRLIKMFSLKGEIVLDPFLGSGRTLEECRKLDRNGIGFELNRSNEPEIKRRIRHGMKNIAEWSDEG